MTIGGLGTYGCIYDVWVNQSTNAKNTSSSDFSKTMDSAAEMSTVRSRESVHESVVTRHTEYTNPETNEKVPVAFTLYNILCFYLLCANLYLQEA